MTVTTRSNSQIVRNQHVNVPASPPQTPLILRGEDDHEESEDTCTGFKRYASRKKRAFAATLYSENSEDSPPPQTPKDKMRALAAKRPKVLIRRNAGGGGLERLDDSAVNETEGEMEREEVADDMHSRQGEREPDARDADASEDEEVVDEGQENGNESNQSEAADREDYEEERDEGNGDDHDNVEDHGSDGDVNQGESSSDREQNVEGDDSEIDVSAQDDGECHEIERSGRNTPTQDEKFPGEDYSPPQRVRFSRGKCTRTSNKTAQVMITYRVATATKCPCEDRQCVKLVNIGTWGMLGSGSTVCVHCGFKRKGEWQGSGYGFMGRKDLLRHLNTSKCKIKRGLSPEKKTLKEVLGEALYHKINDPIYTIRKKDTEGNIIKHYKCFVCERVVGYRSRHSHHINAKHPRSLNVQDADSD